MKKISWKEPHHGWLGDFSHLPDDHEVTLYHGTHEGNLNQIFSEGLKKDPRHGYVSLTPDPHTAHAYASMTGPSDFRRKGRPTYVPHEQRAVVRIKAKAGWLKNNHDPYLNGNGSDIRDKLTNKSHYDRYREKTHSLPDGSYYAMSEYRVSPFTPEHPDVRFDGYMKKDGPK